VRTHLALALVLAACGPSGRPASDTAAHGASSAASARGPDLLVMRVPRGGGQVRVFGYPSLDSLVWTSSDPAPAVSRVLGFDDAAGLVSFVDTKGAPGRVDFRLDNVALAGRTKLTAVNSIDGSTIYGIAKDGSVQRLTPAGEWSFKPPRPARDLLPLADGALLVFGGADKALDLWKVRPPETKLMDTAQLAGAVQVPRTQAGDRLYFAVDRTLVGVRTRDFEPLKNIDLDAKARALVATPSGDRLYVLPDSAHALDVVDRYREKVSGRIELPGQPEDLRIDPLGRYLLVRVPHDSLYVIAIGTDSLLGAVRSAWRDDLPYVAPDGAIALLAGSDVVFVDGKSLKQKDRVEGGAGDFWYGFAWTGFRPRAASLDQPVSFPSADSTDSARANLPAPDSTTGAPPVTPASGDSAIGTGATKRWLVSFAALISEDRAKEMAAQIRVKGEAAHVLSAPREGLAIYRVVLGPYATREEAERVGRESRQNYWVYLAPQ
jgi:hypothetical protein